MTNHHFVAISRTLLRIAVIRLSTVHRRPLRLARALVVVRQSLVRGCVPRIFLEGGLTRDGMLKSGMEGGMNESYEALDRLLAKASS